MGKAILNGLIRDTSKSNPVITQSIVSVTNSTSAKKLQADYTSHTDRVKILHNANLQAVKETDSVLLAFPPNQLATVLSEPGLAATIRHKFIISILAGVSQESILSHIAKNDDTSTTNPYIVRAIPSMGAQALESSTLLVDEEPRLPEHLTHLSEFIFRTIGEIHHTPAHLFNSLTALNGVVHALMAVSIDALADSCAADGIPRADTLAVAGQCFRGYATLVAQGKEPSELKNSLLIPKGLTVNAMLTLEREGVRKAIHEAVRETSEYTSRMAG